MNLYTKYLEKLKTENILVDIYTDNYDESDYGFIIDFNDDFLLIEKFDKECNYDGLTILLRHNITRIRWSGNDLESVTKLIDSTQRVKSKVNINLESIQTILESVNQLYNHLTVHIQDINSSVCFIGEIHEMDNSSVAIHEFGTMSSLDRKFILLSLGDITRVDVNGQYERNLKKLFRKS
ncbi:hypothetical protein AWR42_02735 [Riemerella anatipestifer]|uniref:hypothetical protein n=1 Tax=Riemerella anatipestifer TaxID=34085 RepID=UPI0007EDAC3C|nr:hypothetical protein [Riemerella anatipestifer]MBT0549603.1 hypothetical protein [Riemerella anatipestifer]MBT0556513.1 hypothetical protein [Riemerella anatipestifer]MBT0560369.1 hypothetical protein [Riemerella anatipestifer]MDY3524669.1 hypothetical protein [Riemerella anatipestifer]NAV16816.1 hypothetical protein [Riemerella anatipestifer]